MKNVDVEIYVTQLISFFDKNPTDFMDLIGEENKELFYQLEAKEYSLGLQCFVRAKIGQHIRFVISLN